MTTEIKPAELIESARNAQENAYSPYSKFRVGAALLTKNGKVYTGCNVENASYPCGVCAERTAIYKAVSEGEKDFLAIAVVGSAEELITPCGFCRQVIREFGAEMPIYCTKGDNSYEMFTLDSILPHSFGPENLN